MAESERAGQDRGTHGETPPRGARGQLPRSRELNTLAILMAGAGGLLIYGADLAGALLRLMRSNFELSRETAMNTESMLQLLGASAYLAAQGLWPILLMLLVAAIVGPIALGGWLFSMDALQPKFSRLNPLSGLKRMFSAKSLLELSKALIKFLVVLAVALLVLSADRDALLALAHQPLEQAILHSVRVVGWSAFWMACSLLLIAAVDVPYQIWDNRQKLLMTKQEVRDEYKDSEGKPEVKSKIRQMQREMAQRRMMAAVPEADVVITNPTHFAVALKYDPAGGGAAAAGQGQRFPGPEDPRGGPGAQGDGHGVAGAGASGVLLHRAGPGDSRRALSRRGPGTGLCLPAQAVPGRQGQAAEPVEGPADPAGPASRRVTGLELRAALWQPWPVPARDESFAVHGSNPV